MSLWALLAAPLLAGNDLANMTPATVALLTNPEVIAIDQDARGSQGERVWVSRALEVWVKPLVGDSKAVGFFNRSDSAREAQAEVHLSELGLKGRVHGRDVWNHKDLGLLPETLRVTIPAHGVVLLTVGPGPRPQSSSHPP